MFLQIFSFFFILTSSLLWYKTSLLLFCSITIICVSALIYFQKNSKLTFIALLAVLSAFLNQSFHNSIFPKQCFIGGKLSGLVQEIPRQASFNSWKIIVATKNYGKLQIKLKAGQSLPQKGDQVELQAYFLPIQNFETNYFRSQDLTGKAIAERIFTIHNPLSFQGKFLQLLGETQIRLINIHKVLLPKDKADLMVAMLIGSQNLSKELRVLGQNLGVAHLFAASALNLTALAWFLNYLAGFFKLSKRPKIILVLIAITFYSLLAGWGPSISRAWFMAFLVLSGQLIYRKPNLLNILLFSLLISLFFDINLIGDLGFQFSYLATLGLILWTEKLINKFNFMPRSCAEPIAITIAAEALILPLQFLYFQNIPLYGNLANLIAVPLGNGILISGLLASLLSTLGSLGWQLASFIEFIAAGFINLFFWWLNWLSTFPASDLKLENIHWLWTIWLYALIVYLAFLQKHNLFKHFLIASAFFLFLWTQNLPYMTLTSLSRPWLEGLLLITEKGQKIFICHGSQFEANDLKKLSIHSLDYWIGDCPKPNNLPIKHLISLKDKIELQINSKLTLRVSPKAVLILYKNFSGLVLFEPLMTEKPKQFYSLIKFAYNSKSIIWSHSPKAEFCLTPYLAKQPRKQAFEQLHPICKTTINYLEAKNQKFYIDGKILAFPNV